MIGSLLLRKTARLAGRLEPVTELMKIACPEDITVHLAISLFMRRAPALTLQ